MVIVDADGSCQLSAYSAQVGWLHLRVGGNPALSLHLPNELGELLQWLGAMMTAPYLLSWLLLLFYLMCFTKAYEAL